jgi:hypothetical protein
MRKTFAVALTAMMTVGALPVTAGAQNAAVSGVAQGSDKAPLRNYTVQIRDANTGQLAASTTSNQAGEFAFTALVPADYVVEIVDAKGKVVGVSAKFAVPKGSSVNVTVSAAAAGAISDESTNKFSILGLGPLASVGVIGAASAAGVVAVVATKDGKIQVCHKAGTTRQTIEIKESDREFHLAHGDTLGACPASPSR